MHCLVDEMQTLKRDYERDARTKPPIFFQTEKNHGNESRKAVYDKDIEIAPVYSVAAGKNFYEFVNQNISASDANERQITPHKFPVCFPASLCRHRFVVAYHRGKRHRQHEYRRAEVRKINSVLRHTVEGVYVCVSEPCQRIGNRHKLGVHAV